MARPTKSGLAYFPFDTDFFEDDRIIDLLDEYGTAGVTVYITILCLIYKNGYYIEMDIHKLARIIERKIGNRWLKNNLTEKIIHTIISLGLFDSGFALSGVITSAAVQQRYAAATLRRKVNPDKYWLLPKNEENGRALESAPENGVSATEIRVIATETTVSATEIPIKEKRNKITTTTTEKPPSFAEVHDYFKHESCLDQKCSAARETARFITYNAARGWDCLPRWREAADLWVERIGDESRH